MTRKTNTPAAAALASSVRREGDAHDAARERVSGPHFAMQGLTAWMGPWQRLHAQSIAAWAEAVADCTREAEEADDIDKLMALPASLINRQCDVAVRQFGGVISQWLESELELGNALREQAMVVYKHLVPPLDKPKSAADATDDALQLPWEATQAQWLTSAQRWIDSIGASARH